jgi:replication initiation protein RepC
MTNAQSSGWRGLKPTLPALIEPEVADKKDLFEASHMAARVLHLSSNARFVLDQLVGCYRGELVEGRILVWPSNEFLCERTGIPERSVRYALAQLIAEGVIASKDSANGKRFAQRSAQGQIIRAYGFDLSPLLARLTEFQDRLAAIKEAERERSLAFDELTINRRAAQEALRTLAEIYPETDIADLTARALELVRVTPRRSATGSADSARDAWKVIRDEAESRYYAASAGNSCRHKDNNKYAPDQSCNNGFEDVREPERPRVSLNAGDVARACPDAMEFIGEVRGDRDLIMGVSRMRGAFGVSPSAWEEAAREIGALGAAVTLVYVVQMQMRPAPGSDPIKNAGGYFRALVRLIRSGQVDLAKELARLLRG